MVKLLASILLKFSGVQEALERIESKVDKRDHELDEIEAKLDRQGKILDEIKQSVVPPAGGTLKKLQLFWIP